MRRVSAKDVVELHGGVLPADAVLQGERDGAASKPPAKPPRRSARGERFAALNAFVDCMLPELTGAELKVWLILFRDVKASTGTARTGQTDIGRRAGLSRRGVQVALESLKAKRLVIVARRGRLGKGPSVYRVRATSPA